MRFYAMKYRLPMSHSSSGNIENGHHHILEVAVCAKTAEEMELEASGGSGESEETQKADFGEAAAMERVMRECLDGYRNQYLNGLDEFGGDASIENITEVFYQKIAEAYHNNGWALTKIEVGENPLRVCVIENRNT